jgi:hypothetical protein
MSEMSRAQGPASGDADLNPTDDMVPPGAESQRDPDAPQVRSEYDGFEDVGPQDYGAEDVTSQDYGSADKPPPRTGESVDEESSPPAQSSSDPMPDISGQAQPDSWESGSNSG